ncbi:MAG: hypothetical protein AB1384_08195 [Actinomycetota bacterium]
MKPNPRFLKQEKTFWADIRFIGQEVGYSERGADRIKIPSISEIEKAYKAHGLDSFHIINAQGNFTEYGKALDEYFQYRSRILNNTVKPLLMDAARASSHFKRLKKKLKPKCHLPMNKQKGDKRAPAYLTGISNMLIEANIGGLPCDFNPRALTMITIDGKPVRTFARRIDGAFPAVVNPIAVWEYKEYYYTTSFGSRIADGVYESLLDGMEIEELQENEAIEIKHYLIVDGYSTWWEQGKSYLCRLIDMLHMGYVDEVLFGEEVLDRIPSLTKEWASEARQRERK